MKTVVICILMLIQGRLFGQGIIVFQNSAQNVNAPITNAAGHLIAAPSPYVADLFWNTNTQASMDDLTGFNMPVSFSSNPGYFYGGGRSAGPPIPTLVQVRVWDNSYGSTYYTARDNGGEFGYSNILIITPDVPPGGGAYLIGLQGFQLQRLPRLTTFVTTTNTIVFSWPIEQTVYAVQQNPDIASTNWVLLPDESAIVGQQEQVTIPVPTTGIMFYRLVSQ